ncbi:MAG: hypothetical protein WCJ30_21250, partial [Deltaproteobacteria bacterium]
MNTRSHARRGARLLAAISALVAACSTPATVTDGSNPGPDAGDVTPADSPPAMDASSADVAGTDVTGADVPAYAFRPFRRRGTPTPRRSA